MIVRLMRKNTLLKALLCLTMLSGCASKKTEESASAAPLPSAESGVKTYSNVAIDAGFDTIITFSEQTDDKDAFNEHFAAVQSCSPDTTIV